MIQLTPHVRIFVAVEPADFRKGIDGLANLCRTELQSDPFSGAYFVFRNRKGSAIKILAYDGQGYWLCQKRLSKSRFHFWPSGEEPSRQLEAHELQLLLSGGDPDSVHVPGPWRRLEKVG